MNRFPPSHLLSLSLSLRGRSESAIPFGGAQTLSGPTHSTV